MKKFVLAIAVFPLFSFAAYAADLPNTKGAPAFAPPPPPAFTWSGFYIGANAGYAWGSSADFLTGGDPATQFFMTAPGNFPVPLATSFRQAGVLGGGQIGYNWQFSSSFVAGIETDFDGAHVSGHGSFVDFLDPGAFGNRFPVTTNAGRTLDWFGTVRARLGFLVMPNLLLYGTGGLAYGETTANGNVLFTANHPAGTGVAVGAFTFICSTAGISPTTCYSGSGSSVSVGWAAGAGAEYKLTNNLSLKVEYLHVALAGQTIQMVSPSPPSSAGVFVNGRFDPEDVNIVRAGINYQFDMFAPPGPAMAKY